MTAATRRSPRRRRLLGVLALAIILGVVVLVLVVRGSSDEPKLTVINGADSAGFPLRGDLARDGKLIRAAAEGWLADDAREDDDDQVLDHDEDVEMRALWAGGLHGEQAVILAADRQAALLQVGPRDEFRAIGVQPIRDADQPAVVAFDQAVLVDTEADPTFMTAEARENNVAPLDGLWTTTGKNAASGLPDGGLVLRAGLRRLGDSGDRTGPVVVVTANSPSTWLIDTPLEAKLVPGVQTFSPEAYQRLVAATTAVAERNGAQWETYFDPPDLRLVQDRTLPVLGPTMVLIASRRSGRDEVLAAHGGSPVANAEGAEALGLGGGEGNDGVGARGKDGPALAAALVDRANEEQPDEDSAIFVAGSPEIETIEVLIGRERLTRPGPVAVIELPAATDDAPRADLAVLGRTRSGALVVPRAVAGG